MEKKEVSVADIEGINLSLLVQLKVALYSIPTTFFVVLLSTVFFLWELIFVPNSVINDIAFKEKVKKHYRIKKY